jgi:hypothetical protein
MTASVAHKRIKAAFPALSFTLHAVSFSDLARESRLFVDSSAWGATLGGREVFEGVKALFTPEEQVIVSW